MRHISTTVATASAVATAFLAGGAATGVAAPALDWTPFPSATEPATQCAWLTRPMDTRTPNGAKVRLRVMRTPATGTPDERIGTLFYNPGGPGAAATPIFPVMAAGFAPEGRKASGAVPQRGRRKRPSS